MACCKDLLLEGTDTQTKNGGNLDGKLGGRFLLYAKRPTHKKTFVPSLKRMKGSFAGKSLVQSGSKS